MGMFRNLMMRRRRNVIPGFVGGWKSYGRSNSEDASTRDILPDYSGNGRDIKLYNFAFAGMSGFGGYKYDFSNWLVPNNPSSNFIQGNILTVGSVRYNQANAYYGTSSSIDGFKIRVKGLTAMISSGEVSFIKVYFDHSGEEMNITEDGDYDISLSPAKDSGAFQIHVVKYGTSDWTPLTTPITIEQLPTYPGGLVSDGVDDYGECVKQFVLTDFTVVALRNYADFTQVDNATLVAKTTGFNANGAFLFEDGPNMDCFSFGSRISNSDSSALFSYLTKTSFNGKDGTPGTRADTDNALLHLFSRGSLDTTPKKQAVLYDLRIYDHSLTDEELQLVKDDMMRNYEKNAKPLDGITYVADWDGKDRSNEEDEPMRSQWVDKKTGKVIELHNFAFAGMSGWGGYQFNWANWISNISNSGGTVERTQTSVKLTNLGNSPNLSILYKVGISSISSFKIRITGLKSGATVFFTGIGNLMTASKDGIYTIPADDSSPDAYRLFVTGYAANESADLYIEQLPLYPGALVSDGVDDYGVTQEAINEEVGTILLHYRRLIEVPTEWGYYYDGLNSARIYAAYSNTSPYFYSNLMEKYNDGNLFIGTTSQTADAILHIMANQSAVERGQVAIFRLIIIREQLNETQIAYLVNKVQKEYNDWCKANGYDYAIING